MRIKKDVLIIGSGMSGLAAAHFAIQKGLSCAVASTSAGCMGFAPGTLDLCSVHPVKPITYHDSPQIAIDNLIKDKADHPFAKIGIENILSAWNDFGSYLETSPLKYSFDVDENVNIITAAGTLKPSNMVPQSLRNNADVWSEKIKTLIIDISELKNFSAKQVTENLKERWTTLDAATISIEDLIEQKEIHILKLCSLLEKEDFCLSFCDKIKEKLNGHMALGLPEICGFTETASVLKSLENELKVKVFEIPGPPPTGTGSRLLQILRDDLINKGVEMYIGHTFKNLSYENGLIKEIILKGLVDEKTIEAEHVILATGRFFGGGLIAESHGVREALFDLPVRVSENRDDWHMDSLLGAPGHSLNSCGIDTDALCRPLTKGNSLLYDNLYAVGSILANQDWVREKSGTGIAVSTAWQAIENISK